MSGCPVALERPRARAVAVRRGIGRAALFLFVLAAEPEAARTLPGLGRRGRDSGVSDVLPGDDQQVRGLQSADRQALELMRSYAAGSWRVLLKLRVPAALPYIFAALKVSATANVVGAIIGELPSSIQDGLGGQIINYSQYYTSQPTGLWATNVIAAALGICFFLAVLLAERIVIRAPENLA
jgi:Binding-protein-dependent transport system inner membrane component